MTREYDSSQLSPDKPKNSEFSELKSVVKKTIGIAALLGATYGAYTGAQEAYDDFSHMHINFDSMLDNENDH